MAKYVSSEPANLTYVPISNWAIAGLVVAGAFGVLVAVSTVFALYERGPVLFPEWTLALPILGALLSIIAYRKIADSEGTRTGLHLARWGLLISLVAGLGYFSYYYSLRLAHVHQANQFLMEEGPESGFFPKIENAGGSLALLAEPFLLTLPAGARPKLARTLTPEERLREVINLFGTPGPKGEPSPWLSYQENYLVQSLARGGRVVPLAVQSWSYQARSYRVLRLYKVTTGEFETEVELSVESSEAEETGRNRKWFLNLNRVRILSKLHEVLTPLGKGVWNLQHSGDLYLRGPWMGRLEAGEPWSSYADVDQKTPWEKILMGPKEDVPAIRAALRFFFQHAGPKIVPISLNHESTPTHWGLENDRFWVRRPVEISIPANPQHPDYVVHGYLKIALKQAIPPIRFAGGDAGADWHVVDLVLTHIAPPPRKG